jgi:hypothetical protein
MLASFIVWHMLQMQPLREAKIVVQSVCSRRDRFQAVTSKSTELRPGFYRTICQYQSQREDLVTSFFQWLLLLCHPASGSSKPGGANGGCEGGTHQGGGGNPKAS